MILSAYAWESLGFRPLREGEVIEAVFCSLHIYAVQGFTLHDASAPILSDGSVANASYRIALGTSINELTRSIANDEFTDDEPTWAKENNCAPPYAAVLLGPTAKHTCTDGFVKDDGVNLQTADRFGEARVEMRALESKVLPSLVAALTCGFGADNHPVRFRPVTSVFLGRTSDGRDLRDLRFSVQMTAHSSVAMPSEEARVHLAEAAAFAARINSSGRCSSALYQSRFFSILRSSFKLARYAQSSWANGAVKSAPSFSMLRNSWLSCFSQKPRNVKAFFRPTFLKTLFVTPTKSCSLNSTTQPSSPSRLRTRLFGRKCDRSTASSVQSGQ